ncbi:hypothetical protein [Pseudomonas saponiphila]|uniref:hypothetical protein n=1 Tax=Pseudomonas saponiphila TaxID=556534 RepID=UPI002240127D|nr:hypothetical protein [Pseudomonas saponiphila]
MYKLERLSRSTSSRNSLIFKEFSVSSLRNGRNYGHVFHSWQLLFDIFSAGLFLQVSGQLQIRVGVGNGAG